MCKYRNGPGLHRFSVKPGAICAYRDWLLINIQLDAPFRDIHYRSAAVGTFELGNISAREVEAVAVGVGGELFDHSLVCYGYGILRHEIAAVVV